MTFAETINNSLNAINNKQITVWNEKSIAFSEKAFLRTQKYLSGHNLAESLGKAITKAVKNYEFNVEIQFKMPYHLWKLEPQLAPCKNFWKEKGVRFRTVKGHNGEPHTIWFSIPWSASSDVISEIEGGEEFSESDTPTLELQQIKAWEEQATKAWEARKEEKEEAKKA